MKNISNKSRTVSFILAFLLGAFGAHRFYANKIGTAIVQLVLTLTFIGIYVSGIWAFIDMIMILAGGFRDKEGNLIKKW